MPKQPDIRKEKALQKTKAKYQKTIFIYGAPCNRSTGNGKLIHHMAKAFQAGGHEVVTIGIECNRPMIWFDNIPILPSFHCEKCGNASKGSDENVQKIAEYINLWPRRPDFFICVGDPYQMQQFGIGNLGFEKINIKAIMYATTDSEGMFCNDILKEDGLKDYVSVCDRVIGTAKYTQEQFKKYLNINTDLIYETIDMDIYSPVSNDKKRELKKKYRFKPDDFVIYYSGRNLMRKRHNILFDACAKFICETKDTYLYVNIPMSVVGDRAFYPDAVNPLDFVKRILKKKYKRDLIDEKRIIFIGRGGLGSEEITEGQNAEIYQMSDIYVTTTAGEGFGLCPIESLACGTPVIVPDNSTGREIIGVDTTKEQAPESGFQFGKGGLLTNCPIEEWIDYGLKQYLTTPEITYKAIKFLYNDPELRQNLGKQGREYVKKTFNMELFKMKWLEIIKTTEKKKEGKEEFKSMEIKTTGEKTNG